MDTPNRLLALTERNSLDRHFNDLSNLMTAISAQEINMGSHLQLFHTLSNDTMRRFAEWITAPDTDSIQSMLDQIHFLVTGSEHLKILGQEPLFQELATYMKVCLISVGYKSIWCVYLLLTEPTGWGVLHSEICESNAGVLIEGCDAYRTKGVPNAAVLVGVPRELSWSQ